MRKILVIGAGKSAAVLVQYLQKKSANQQLHITIGDLNPAHAAKLVNNHTQTTAIALNCRDREACQDIIEKSDIVISLLPAHLHMLIAKDCLELHTSLVTASYVSEEMQSLHDEVKRNGLIFLNEMGLDPGIDHMSAMQTIDAIREQVGEMILFESFAGGLVAPENDNNLWNYKFTWNPRNVVLSGQGGAAKFLQEGTYKYIPYHKLFRRTEFLEVEGYGRFEAYANRNSLKYRDIYGLQNVSTLYRGTIRRIGFSKAWNVFVQLGMTADDYVIENSENMSYREFTNLFLAYAPNDSVELKLRHYLKIDQDDILWDKLTELDIFNAEKKIKLPNATPAQILQRILSDSWTLQENEKDMIVMYHKFGFKLNGKLQQIDATMVTLGENQRYTAMAKTVGLPLGMAALLILNKKSSIPKGVQIPIDKVIYEPVLKELREFGIHFNEKTGPYVGYNPHGVR